MSNTVLPGHTMNVGAGQTSSGVIVDAGGTLNVLSGGKVSSTIDSGLVNVSSGGKAVDTTVASGGTEFVSVGGLDTGTTVQSGGLQTVFSGGTAKGTIVFGDSIDAQRILAGGSALNTTLHANRILEGFASITSIVGNVEDIVAAGGTSVITKVFSGGDQDIFLGTAISTTVSSGGRQDVNGGFARPCGRI
jgi:autotransporter passenger strand-loop-strand repeat protein